MAKEEISKKDFLNLDLAGMELHVLHSNPLIQASGRIKSVSTRAASLIFNCSQAPKGGSLRNQAVKQFFSVTLSEKISFFQLAAGMFMLCSTKSGGAITIIIRK
jgi:hypothetical protein